MGPATQKRRTKNSPGLHGTVATKEQVLEARREKNREAQQVFRKRRQAAEAATGRRIKRLENVVEEMSSTLIGLFDDILATEALVTQHPSIVTSLQKCLARVLVLSQEVTNPDGGSSTPADNSTAASGDCKEHAPEHVIGNAGTTSTQQHRPLLPVASPPVVDSSSAKRQSMMSWQYTPSLSIYSPATLISAGYTPTDQLLASLPLPPSPNAFIDSLDPLIPQSLGGLPRPAQESVETAYSFPFKLIEISLTHAYSLITTAPLSAIQREFGMTLRHHKRDDIIASIQWALGPGRWYMYQSSKPRLQGDLDSSALPSADPLARTSSSAARNAEFLTAVEVYELLKNLGATMIDMDTMEIQITKARTSPEIPPYPAGTSSYPDRLSSHPLAFEALTTTMRLNVPLLMSHLMHIGVCFEAGPGYPQREVWRAIQASGRLV